MRKLYKVVFTRTSQGEPNNPIYFRASNLYTVYEYISILYRAELMTCSKVSINEDNHSKPKSLEVEIL